jgi:hypothetical protein
MQHNLPNVEIVTTDHNACTLQPAVPVSFILQGPDQDGRANAALGNGPSDGYEKTVIYQGGLPGCPVRVALWTISESGGAVILKWSTASAAWSIVNGFNYT